MRRPLLVAALLIAAVVLAPLLAASATPPQMPAVKLPPIPKYIASVLGPVEVHRVSHLMCGEVPALGCYTQDSRTLELDDSLPLVVAWVVLRHERAHMVWADANVRFPTSAQEDALADVMARADVLEMLAANP